MAAVEVRECLHLLENTFTVNIPVHREHPDHERVRTYPGNRIPEWPQGPPGRTIACPHRAGSTGGLPLHHGACSRRNGRSRQGSRLAFPQDGDIPLAERGTVHGENISQVKLRRTPACGRFHQPERIGKGDGKICVKKFVILGNDIIPGTIPGGTRKAGCLIIQKERRRSCTGLRKQQFHVLPSTSIRGTISTACLPYPVWLNGELL